MAFETCPDCGQFDYTPLHKCKPAFYVWCEETGDEACARKIHAIDGQAAAEEWAERYDSETAEYSIVSGHDAVACVRAEGEETVTRYNVSGESQPVYSASEIVPSEKAEP